MEQGGRPGGAMIAGGIGFFAIVAGSAVALTALGAPDTGVILGQIIGFGTILAPMVWMVSKLHNFTNGELEAKIEAVLRKHGLVTTDQPEA